MKKTLIGLALVALLAVVWIAVVYLRLDPEALGARAIDLIHERSGLELEATSFTLHPLQGLEMAEVRLSGRLDSGEVLATAALVRMRHRLVPLFRGDLVIQQVLLQEPEIELLTRSAKESGSRKARRRAAKRRGKEERSRQQSAAAGVTPGPSVRPEPERLRLSSVETLRVRDATLAIRSRGQQQADFKVEGVDLELAELTFDAARPAGSGAVSGSGWIQTGRIFHGDLEATRSSGQIRLADGLASLTELDLESENADLSVRDLAISYRREPLEYSLQAAGGFDLNGLLGFEDKDGFGPVAVTIDAVGQGPDTAAMAGQGRLTLQAGSIPGMPSVVRIEELLGTRILTGRKYERAEAEYRLAENKILLLPLEIEGEGLTVGCEGEIDLAGPLALLIRVRLPLEALESGGLEEGELERQVEEKGWITVPFQVTGTLEEPKVELTGDGVQALASGATRNWVELAVEEAKKRATEWLRNQADSKDED